MTPRRKAAPSPRRPAKAARGSASATSGAEAATPATEPADDEPAEGEIVSEPEHGALGDHGAPPDLAFLNDGLDDALDGEVVSVAAGAPPATPESPSASLVPYVPLPRGRGVMVRRDALSRYMAEIQRFDRLSPAEESELARRYRATGDREALARLVTSNLRLVVAVALGFRRAIANVLDLIQEGNLGLLEALERYDPAVGTRLSTYATWWIRSRIVKYLLDNWRLVRVGTTNARRKLLYNLRSERERLERLGITPTPKLIAERLGTTQEDVVAVSQALGASDQSLDAPLTPDSDTPRAELLAAPGASPEDLVEARDMHDRLQAVLAEFTQGLPPREQALMRERLLSDDPITLQDLAAREGVTREAVRQAEVRLLARLREFLQRRLPEAADIRVLPEE